MNTKRTNIKHLQPMIPFTLRLSKELRQRLNQMARANGRSMNTEITRAIEDRVKKFETKGDTNE